MTPTVKALKAPTNLLKWWSVANSNAGTVRKKELLQGLPTNETGLLLCEAATNQCPHTEGTAVHIFMPACHLGSLTQLFSCLPLQLELQWAWCPVESYLHEKIQKGKCEFSGLFPLQLPSKNQMMCPAGRFCFNSRTVLFLELQKFLNVSEKTHNTQSSLQWTIFALSNL